MAFKTLESKDLSGTTLTRVDATDETALVAT